MKRILWVLCFALVLCTAHSIVVSASELKEDENYIYYETGVYDKSTGEYFLYEDIDSDGEGDGLLDSDNDGDILDGGEQLEHPSLSDEHLSILDALGELLDYVPSGEEEELELDELEDDVLSDAPDDSDFIEDIAQNVSLLSDIALFSDYNTYAGAISPTYLEYFRGFLGKLPHHYHYVCYRESQYVYSFVFGDDLSYSGKRFVGSGLTRVTWNTYNSGSYGINHESSFTLNAGSNMVYTDLGTDYPALVAYDGYQLIQIKWVLLISVMSFWMISLYKGYRRKSDVDKKYSHVNSK